MSKPLALPENQARALIRAAKKEGNGIEVTRIPGSGREDTGGGDMSFLRWILNILIALCWLAAAVFAWIAVFNSARAHEAPMGWRYDRACCSNRDCRQVADADIGETAAGYLVKITGETVPYTDSRIRTSPDGRFHWCRYESSKKTICLYVPPRAF